MIAILTSRYYYSAPRDFTLPRTLTKRALPLITALAERGFAMPACSSQRIWATNKHSFIVAGRRRNASRVSQRLGRYRHFLVTAPLRAHVAVVALHDACSRKVMSLVSQLC